MLNSSFCRASVVVVCIFGLFLTGCGGTTGPTTNAPVKQTTCAPAGANIYQTDIQPEIDYLYSRLFPDQNNFNSSTLDGIKIEAFILLRDRVKRWSSSSDLLVDNQNVIRITLTFISPELLQTILLNDQLYQPIITRDQFRTKLKEKMDGLAKREELVFLATITYSSYNQNETEDTMKLLEFPIKGGTALVNAEGRRINPGHYDPPLAHEIVISRGPLSGYINFPIGIMDGESCIHVLDPLWNTMVTVNANGFKIKGVTYSHPSTWFVKYGPLVDMEGSGVPTPPLAATNLAETLQHHQPPIPMRNVPASQESMSYWEMMAIHIWTYVVDP